MSAGELIPTDGLVDMDITPVPHGSSRMGGSGQSIVGRVGPTRWRMKVATDTLDEIQARVWSTWLQRRIDLGETFTAWKLWRVNPLLGTGVNPDGAITLSVDIANNRISLGGVPGYTASAGDFISYRDQMLGYYLGQVQATTAAVGSNCSNIPILPKPRVPTGTPAVRRVQALGEFEITTPLDPWEDYTNRSLSFEAIQVLR